MLMSTVECAHLQRRGCSRPPGGPLRPCRAAAAGCGSAAGGCRLTTMLRCRYGRRSGSHASSRSWRTAARNQGRRCCTQRDLVNGSMLVMHAAGAVQASRSSMRTTDNPALKAQSKMTPWTRVQPPAEAGCALLAQPRCAAALPVPEPWRRPPRLACSAASGGAGIASDHYRQPAEHAADSCVWHEIVGKNLAWYGKST
jgi:hypothetical protein